MANDINITITNTSPINITIDNLSGVEILKVDTYNDLPITNNYENRMAFTKDTDFLYTWKLSATSGTLDDWQPVGRGVDQEEVNLTIYGDAFVTTKISSFVIGNLLTAKNIDYIKILVDVAPTGSDLILDINKNGTTIFTTQGNRPTISNGNTESSQHIPDVTLLTEDDIMSIDIDSIGSTIAGGNNIYLFMKVS